MLKTSILGPLTSHPLVLGGLNCGFLVVWGKTCGTKDQTQGFMNARHSIQALNLSPYYLDKYFWLYSYLDLEKTPNSRTQVFSFTNGTYWLGLGCENKNHTISFQFNAGSWLYRRIQVDGWASIVGLRSVCPSLGRNAMPCSLEEKALVRIIFLFILLFGHSW